MKEKTDITDFKRTWKGEFKFNPTKNQQLAMDKISNFIHSNDPFEIFILTGYAGTGKTTLIANLIQTFRKTQFKCVALAPTGRAAKVLSTYSKSKALTIHRKIYITEKDEISTGSSFSLAANKHSNTFFIIDEASMIAAQTQSNDYGDKDVLADLIEYVYSGENCKIIFVGDKGQLPPVGSDKSPALDENYIKSHYHFKVYSSDLLEIVRQENESGILTLASMYRKFNKTIPKISPFQDVKLINGTELQEEIESAYQKFGQDEVMVVTRSNKRANMFNQHIRQKILWQEEDLNAGDILMVTKNNYFWVEAKSKIGFIANGEMMEILKIIRREKMYGYEFADVLVRLIDYPDIPEMEFKINLHSIHSETANLSRDELKMLFYNIAREDYPFELNTKNRNRLLMNHPYFQALQVKFGYAVTCHKAQGGQWKSVFIDQGYFVHDMWNEDYMRWLYTAFTRASDELNLVSFSDEFLLTVD